MSQREEDHAIDPERRVFEAGTVRRPETLDTPTSSWQHGPAMAAAHKFLDIGEIGRLYGIAFKGEQLTLASEPNHGRGSRVLLGGQRLVI